MMKKIMNAITLKISAVIIAILFCNTVLAQKSKMEDVVYLKNGSIIRGELQDTLNYNSVKIETIGRNVFVFKPEEIEKITKEEYVSEKSKFIPKSKGYNNITNIGLIMNEGFSLQTINGYKFNSVFFGGLGLSLEGQDNGGPLFSTFFDFRFEPIKGRNTPFAYLQGGYSFPLNRNTYGWGNTEYYGGFLSETGLGFKSNFNNNTALVFSFGYTYRSLKSSYEDWGWGGGNGNRIYVTDIFGRMSVRLGFNFN